MNLTPQQVTAFQETVWEYFRDAKRAMPWRDRPDPYYVLVSELMLQQTQVPRVIPKFEGFIERFPNAKALAGAKLADVLSEWNGLGYNRRAKFLHMAAKMVESVFGGTIPNTIDDLVKLPGVGPNTAGAILAYAYNQPVVFIETNIRTVYIHHFFHDQSNVNDKQILELVGQTLPAIREEQRPVREANSDSFRKGAMRNPERVSHREWYWALMDYGTHLKQTLPGRNVQSKHYKKQGQLAGSLREMRGRIIRALVGTSLSEEALREQVAADDRFVPAINGLKRDGLVIQQNEQWCLTGRDDTR